MTLWVQHGYGKGDKLTRLAPLDGVSGVVLSPADESAERLSETAAACGEAGLAVAVDPQTYVYTIPQGAGRLHAEHGLDFGDLSWAPAPSTIAEQVDAVVRLSASLDTDLIISPAPLQQSFGDVWTPVSIQYARATLASADRPCLATIAVMESAFASWEEVERWLDAVTTLDVDGFYLIVSRSSRDYPPAWVPQVLTNILRVVYRLSVLNNYRVVWGYSDVAGLLGLAAGAESIGSGWFYGLRSFNAAKWQPSTGGSQAIPRVFAPGLLSDLEAAPEGRPVAGSSLGDRAFPGETTRNRLIDDVDSWGAKEAWHQHLAGLSAVARNVAHRRPGTLDAIAYLTGRAHRASARLQALRDEGIVLRPAYSTIVGSYQTALNAFVAEEGL